MSRTDTMMVFAGRYHDKSAAIRDFESVNKLYKEGDLIDTYDAAVIQRKDNGEIKILRKREEPTRHGAAAGLGIGLAAGVVAAVFPPVALGGALVAGGAGGAAFGALTGHVTRGMSRGDLKEIGELLDRGESGLVVVAATDLEDRMLGLMTEAEEITTEQIAADLDQLDIEVAAVSTKTRK
jgi:uncharacterized membrane protein